MYAMRSYYDFSYLPNAEEISPPNENTADGESIARELIEKLQIEPTDLIDP